MKPKTVNIIIFCIALALIFAVVCVTNDDQIDPTGSEVIYTFQNSDENMTVRCYMEGDYMTCHVDSIESNGEYIEDYFTLTFHEPGLKTENECKAFAYKFI